MHSITIDQTTRCTRRSTQRVNKEYHQQQRPIQPSSTQPLGTHYIQKRNAVPHGQCLSYTLKRTARPSSAFRYRAVPWALGSRHGHCPSRKIPNKPEKERNIPENPEKYRKITEIRNTEKSPAPDSATGVATSSGALRASALRCDTGKSGETGRRRLRPRGTRSRTPRRWRAGSAAGLEPRSQLLGWDHTTLLTGWRSTQNLR